MNNTEKLFHRKLAEKKAENAKPEQVVNRSPEQQTPAIQQYLQLAIRHHNEGRLPEAKSIYQQILQADPNQPLALHLLGVIAHQVGNHDDAVDLINKALAINPDLVEANNNLGNALKKLGRLDEAVASYLKALAINPDSVGVHNSLGNALKELGRLDEAMASYQKATAIKPDYPEAYYNLGLAFEDLGEPEEAVANYQKAIAIRPEFAVAHYNLGAVLQNLGKLDEAVASYNKAIALKPDYAETHHNLGVVLQNLGKLDEAVASYHEAITLKPTHIEAHGNLGVALQDMGKFVEAVATYQKALAIKPDYADAHSNLGNAFVELDRLDEAVASFHEAIAINPEYAEAHSNLGVALKKLGKLDEAVASYRKALAIKPDLAGAHSNLIFAMLYFPSNTDGDVFEEALRWDKQHSYRGEIAPHDNTPDPERRLRIGYLSADFRAHASSYLLEPLLAEHDRDEVELFCYAEVRRPDHVTEQYKGLADHWRSTVGVGDAKLAHMIRADGIDILVDCTGHTANNRLPALTRKPAPVQVIHFPLGSGSTSGVRAMDYALSDPVLTPPGFEDRFSEELVILPQGAFTFRPDQDWPEVEAGPTSGEGHLFACVGDPVRIGPATIALWARLLEMVPGSQLLFKHKAYGDPKTRETWRSTFKELGDRAIFEGIPGGWAKNMDVYAKVDVALDALPMSGGTSCIIPLWMGVPTITMIGPNIINRVGTAWLTHAGMAEFSAHDPDDYLKITCDLINDPERLVSLRHTLRDTIKASHLMDARGHAVEVEAAFRKMWRKWCAGVSQQ